MQMGSESLDTPAIVRGRATQRPHEGIRTPHRRRKPDDSDGWRPVWTMSSTSLSYIDPESGLCIAPLAAGSAFELLDHLPCVVYLLPAFRQSLLLKHQSNPQPENYLAGSCPSQGGPTNGMLFFKIERGRRGVTTLRCELLCVQYESVSIGRALLVPAAIMHRASRIVAKINKQQRALVAFWCELGFLVREDTAELAIDADAIAAHRGARVATNGGITVAEPPPPPPPSMPPATSYSPHAGGSAHKRPMRQPPSGEPSAKKKWHAVNVACRSMPSSTRQPTAVHGYPQSSMRAGGRHGGGRERGGGREGGRGSRRGRAGDDASMGQLRHEDNVPPGTDDRLISVICYPGTRVRYEPDSTQQARAGSQEVAEEEEVVGTGSATLVNDDDDDDDFGEELSDVYIRACPTARDSMAYDAPHLIRVPVGSVPPDGGFATWERVPEAALELDDMSFWCTTCHCVIILSRETACTA